MCLCPSLFSSSVCFGIASLAAGCSGGSHTGAFTPQAIRNGSDRTVVTPAKLGGIVNTKTFSVASGQTVTVASDLAVFASTAVTIAGTMQVPRGVSVAFFTPSFTIASTGSIVPLTNKHYPGPTHDIVSACQIDVANLWEVGAGDSLGITSSVKRNANPKYPCTVVFATRSESDNHSSLVMDPGVPGGSDPHRYIGQDGGWIVIGSPQAISVTQTLAKKDGHPTLRAFAPDIVTIDSLWPPATAAKDARTISAAAAAAVTVSTRRPAESADRFRSPRDRSAENLPHIAAGNGGSGGDLVLGSMIFRIHWMVRKSRQTQSRRRFRWRRAAEAAGSLSSRKRQRAFGNGRAMAEVRRRLEPTERLQPEMAGQQFALPANASLSGSSVGGSLTLELALPGLKGPHGNNKPNKPKNGKYPLMQFDGGWGSAWINAAVLPAPPPGTSAQGGKGGSFTVVPPPHIESDKLKGYGISITVINFGKGGDSVLCVRGLGPRPQRWRCRYAARQRALSVLDRQTVRIRIYRRSGFERYAARKSAAPPARTTKAKRLERRGCQAR